jgi:RND family efflux transporter MFP subunit
MPVVLVLLAALVAAGLWSLRGTDGANKGKGPATVAVSVTRVKAADVPLQLESSGHVVSLNSVEIRPRTDGTIRRIGFAEGEPVRAGQVLFELEVDDLVAELAYARAEVMRIRAEKDDAQSNLERGRNLVAASYISSSALDALEAKRESLRAQMQAAHANVRAAEARVDRAVLRAPMDARAGLVNARVGARVRQADTEPLVVLRQFDPIGVDFTVPSRYLGAIVQASGSQGLAVEAQTEAGQTVSGRLHAIDNGIDNGTGTIQLRAQFDNPDQALWPGAFVRARLAIQAREQVLVVPAQAVAEGPEGHFLYQLMDDQTVAPHPVTLERVHEGQAVISGIEAGQTVVVEGIRFLRAGSKVRASAHSGEAADGGEPRP